MWRSRFAIGSLPIFALSLPLMFEDDPPGGGGNGSTDDDDVEDEEDDATKDERTSGKPDGVTPEIERWLGKKIAARERKARLAGAKAKEDELAQQRATQEAEEKGEYEKVKTTLTTERDNAIRERDEYKADLDVLSQHFEDAYKADLAELPESFRALAPESSESYEKRSKWLKAAKEQAKKSEGTQPPRRGNGPNVPPRPPQPIKREDEVEKNKRRPGYNAF